MPDYRVLFVFFFFQKAVNDTSRLLSRFEEGALDRNRVNVLLAAQQFEEFGVRYARRYLNTSSTASILKRAEHIGNNHHYFK